ncbi:MAG TPA: porin [Alphaproteobacteria bacterium]|nr:porin [Alphaproteobacteria bacterium]
MRSVSKSLLLVLLFITLGSLAYSQGMATPGTPTTAQPAAASKEEVEGLRQEVAAQRQTIEQLKTMVQQLIAAKSQDSAADRAHLADAVLVQPPTAVTQAAAASPAQKPDEKKELKFSVGGGEVQLYGHADVSLDYVDNGLSNRFGAVGNNGWLAQLSSNLSNFGVRGSRRLVPNLNGIFQIETEVAFSSTPGPTSDAQVKQGLGSRDTYVGLQGPWGAFKFGKEDAPYKRTVGRLDPFLNSIGDNRSIMGNSGGDNRAEFKTRLPHSLWYETPNKKGFWASILFSPGQNRADDNIILARAEPNCNGGNDAPCNDGSWSNVMSAAVTYTRGPLYVITAYEHHSKVNRTGDEGTSSVAGVPPAGSVGIADESAFEAGGQYEIKPSRTTVNFLYEKLKRYAPAVPAFNERSRPNATWLSVVQKITPQDDLNFGWAHAGKTPGDPGGQINQPGTLVNLAGPIDNRANLIDLGFKHLFPDKRFAAYFVYAMQKNHQGAHYDLGAAGHGAVVDRLDAVGNSFTGLTHKGVSGGFIYDF